MPKSQKQRNHVEYDGKATSKARNDIQKARAYFNLAIREGSVPYQSFTPWEKAKQIRLQERLLSGKTYEAWLKRNAKKQPKPSVSNLSV